MNRNLIIVLAGGFVIAVLVALIVQAGLSGKKKAEPVKEEPKVAILVAAQPLDTGAKLDETKLKWQEWPKTGVFEGAIIREGTQKPIEAAQGKVRRPVALGEPITKSALVSQDATSFLAASIGEGMRAVAIDVNAVRSAGGFVGPGDFVDVILSYRESVRYTGPNNPAVDDVIRMNLGRQATETILQNVKVLAVDQGTSRSEEKGVKVGKTVTIEVDRRGAEVIALARGMGELSLALRPLGDKNQYSRDYPLTTDARLTNALDDVYSEIRKVEKRSGQSSDIVRIYNGSSVGRVTIGQ